MNVRVSRVDIVFGFVFLVGSMMTLTASSASYPLDPWKLGVPLRTTLGLMEVVTSVALWVLLSLRENKKGVVKKVFLSILSVGSIWWIIVTTRILSSIPYEPVTLSQLTFVLLLFVAEFPLVFFWTLVLLVNHPLEVLFTRWENCLMKRS